VLSIDGGRGALTKIADIREPGLFGSGRKVGELHSGNSFGESVAIFLFWAAVLITLGLPALIIWGIVGSVRPSARGRVLPQLVACLAIGCDRHAVLPEPDAEAELREWATARVVTRLR